MQRGGLVIYLIMLEKNTWNVRLFLPWKIRSFGLNVLKDVHSGKRDQFIKDVFKAVVKIIKFLNEKIETISELTQLLSSKPNKNILF